MTRARAKILSLLGPTLTLGLLAAGAYVQRDWPKPVDAAPYHERAMAAVKAIPLQVGPWIGTERNPQQAAIEVLKPNAIRNIEFTDPRAAAMLGRARQRVSLSIVQCKSFDDMLGHSPPNCYPAFGDEQTYREHRVWTVAAPVPVESSMPVVQPAATATPLRIDGTEYHFERTHNGQRRRRIVYNFMLAPHQGTLPDMESLRQAAEDYRQRYFGAAQFQVVFDTLAGQEPTVAERDATFLTLMRAAAPAIHVLLDDGQILPADSSLALSSTISRSDRPTPIQPFTLAATPPARVPNPLGRDAE